MLVDAGISLDGASDHGVSEALYLHDPDGNGVELYRDRPQEEWPVNSDGSSGCSHGRSISIAPRGPELA